MKNSKPLTLSLNMGLGISLCIAEGFGQSSYSDPGKKEIYKSVMRKSSGAVADFKTSLNNEDYKSALLSLQKIEDIYAERNLTLPGAKEKRIECLFGMKQYRDVVDVSKTVELGQLSPENRVRIITAQLALKMPVREMKFDMQWILQNNDNIKKTDLPALDSESAARFDIDVFWGFYYKFGGGNNMTKAVQAFEEADRLRPNVPFVQYYLGHYAEGAKNYKDANIWFSKASKGKGYFASQAVLQLKLIKGNTGS